MPERHRETLPTQRESIIMACLAREERFGKDIQAEFLRRTKMNIPSGSLYVTLARMEEKGLVKSRVGNSNPEAGGNKRRYFKLTPAGERSLMSLRIWLAQLTK